MVSQSYSCSGRRPRYCSLLRTRSEIPLPGQQCLVGFAAAFVLLGEVEAQRLITAETVALLQAVLMLGIAVAADVVLQARRQMHFPSGGWTDEHTAAGPEAHGMILLKRVGEVERAYEESVKHRALPVSQREAGAALAVKSAHPPAVGEPHAREAGSGLPRYRFEERIARRQRIDVHQRQLLQRDIAVVLVATQPHVHEIDLGAICITAARVEQIDVGRQEFQTLKIAVSVAARAHRQTPRGVALLRTHLGHRRFDRRACRQAELLEGAYALARYQDSERRGDHVAAAPSA